MAPSAQERRSWDFAAALEAMGVAGVALWRWEPRLDRLSLSGPVRQLGLGPLGSECTAAAIRALTLPQDRAVVDGLLRPAAPGTAISLRLRMQNGDACLWRGAWVEEGERATGVVAAAAPVAASEADPLTGLLNRASFMVRARERLAAPGDHHLVVADLDRLRRLNEALGHDRADLVLAALGSRMAAAFPASAVMARIGEDEFAVLTEAGPKDAAEVLRAALELPLRIAGFDIHPTLAIGAVKAEGGADAAEAAELLRRAELAVETAKGGARGESVSYGRALESDGLSRLALEADLRGAIARHEIVPYFQPVVRLSTGALSGFEALARWNHPRRGIIPPDDFLPLMMEMGMMAELGTHMVRAGAAQLAAWRRKHVCAEDLWVSVNLSTGEIDREGLVEEIGAVISERRLPPKALKLEITESDIMRDPDRAAGILRGLKQVGAGLALDDFGTGFSSLSYLTRLPFDTLKIDRYFVRTMASNEGSAKIVRSVIKLGQDLNLEVVAEGVENSIMASRLLNLGCDYGQGFGYAMPLPPQEAEVYLNEAHVDGVAPVRARG
jgi:c-di-GMP-specific phosphodiesterase